MALSDCLALRPGTEILFFDLAEMEALERVVRSVCLATKHPANPVMGCGDMDAWDCAQASPWATRTVLYDEEERLFKCWYNGTTPLPDRVWHMGYAVSADGVVWEKPNLGLVEFNGRRENNILMENPYGAVIKDLAEPDPAKRYKMRVTGGCRYSPDGIHWTADWTPVPVNWDGPKAWDAVAFLRDDADPDPARRYKYVFQYYGKANKPGPGEVRFKAMVFGATELDWVSAPEPPMLSPNEGFEHENHFLMLIPYKGHYLALYECGWYHPDGTGKYGRYSADIRLAHSRDAIHFTRINPDQPIIARGGRGEWDEQFLVISDKVVIRHEAIYLYYCGQADDWASWPPGNMVPNARVTLTGAMSQSRMGLATLRPDGFTCLEVSDRASFGEATTRPMEFAPPAKDLLLNLGGVCAGRDWLQAEVLDAATGAPLAGFSRADCPPIHTDGLRVPVRWKGGPLGAAAKRPVRLRFDLFGRARLYAFALA